MDATQVKIEEKQPEFNREHNKKTHPVTWILQQIGVRNISYQNIIKIANKAADTYRLKYQEEPQMMRTTIYGQNPKTAWYCSWDDWMVYEAAAIVLFETANQKPGSILLLQQQLCRLAVGCENIPCAVNTVYEIIGKVWH